MDNILIFIYIIVLFIIYYYDGIKEYFTLEYCSENDEYIKPAIYEKIISEEEAKYILEKAKDLFKESEIVGGSVEGIRKSNTAWLSKSDNKIKEIIQRVCTLTNLPIDNAEDLQVVKYEPNGYYRPHHDSCCDQNDSCEKFIKDGGQRKVTMVLYLNDNFRGGETNFPNLKMRLKAPKCGGLLFYPLEKNGNRCHPYALHEGTDIEEGEKYIANIWIRENKFRQ